MSNAAHVDDEFIERYAMNRLSEAESEAVEDHIATCVNSLDRLDQATAFVEGMRTALSDSNGEEKQETKWPRWLQRWGGTPVWAGAALAVAGVLLIVNRPGELPSPALV